MPYISEQQAFDTFVEIFGRYPADKKELVDTLAYVAPLVAWDGPVSVPQKPATTPPMKQPKRPRPSWLSRLFMWSPLPVTPEKGDE